MARIVGAYPESRQVPEWRAGLARRVTCMLCAVLAALLFGTFAPTHALADECPAGGSHEFEAELLRHATADEDGLRVFTCVKCGYSYEDAIPKTGHDWGPWIREVEPTCTSDGLEYRMCRKATHVEHRDERLVPALSATGEHSWEEVERVESTCEQDGSSYRVCSVCGAGETLVLPAIGHDWGAWEVVSDEEGRPTGTEQSVCGNDAGHVRTREARDVPPADSPAASVQAPAPVPPEPRVVQEAGQAPEGPDWKAQFTPNTLDAVLAVGDALALASFLGLSAPLLFPLMWIRRRREQAAQGEGVPDSYGLVLPDARRAGVAGMKEEPAA